MENNRRNSDRDKMLEEILGQINNKKSSGIKSDVRKSPDSRRDTGLIKENDKKNSLGREKEEYSEKLLKTSYIDRSHDMENTSSDKSGIYKPVSGQSHEPYRRTVRTDNPEEKRSAGQGNIRKKKKRRSVRLQVVLILTVVIFTIAICLSVMIISVGRDMLAIGKDESYKIVTIPEGAEVSDISQILYDEGIIKVPKAFEVVVKMGDYEKEFKAGDYELSPSFAYETIITRLITDEYEESETVDVTFLEGVDLHTAAMQLEEAGVCEADRFIYYFNAGGYECDFESRIPDNSSSKFYRMEGYLFPDTYTFYVDMEPELVCRKIYKNFDEKITDEFYDQMNKSGLSLEETIILASMVQAEAGDTETMGKVASVFLNRLHNPEEFPKLESDPTGKYVNDVIKPNIEIPSEAIYDSYDTYICSGLPSGAIGNPGLDAIKAVLYPEDTDYYFFYANLDTRETFFAETLEEQEANIEMVQEERESADDEEE